MSILHYLSSSFAKKFKKQNTVDTTKILGGANTEAEQNDVASFYHS